VCTTEIQITSQHWIQGLPSRELQEKTPETQNKCYIIRLKLPAVITSLDSTLYHCHQGSLLTIDREPCCHQQGFSPKYRRIVFLIIFFSGLISSKYSIFPLKILNNHN